MYCEAKGRELRARGASGRLSDTSATLPRLAVAPRTHLITHGAVLVLTGRIEDVELNDFIVHTRLLSVAVLDSGIICECRREKANKPCCLAGTHKIQQSDARSIEL